MKRNQLLTIAATGLLVAVGGLAKAKAEDVGTRMTDTQITQHVKAKLALDDPSVAPRIMVSTRDGVVTLMGRQLAPADILTAMHDANDTQGVVRVENELKMS